VWNDYRGVGGAPAAQVEAARVRGEDFGQQPPRFIID